MPELQTAAWELILGMADGTFRTASFPLFR